jgi:hypothetical protein
MTAMLRELAPPDPPLLHAPVATVLGPATVEHVWGHLTSGGWLIGVVLVAPAGTPYGFMTDQIDLEVL